MTIDIAHFRSRPEDCTLDPDAFAPLDEAGEWEYTAVPVLDASQHLADGVTPICAQTTYAGGRAALKRLGLIFLDPADLDLLHLLATRGQCIELPAFTNTATAETSLFERIKSDEGNRANARRLGWRPGVRICNWGKGWVSGAPAGRAALMGWWVPNVRSCGITTRSGPGFIQPRPSPGAHGAHGEHDQADDGTNLWGKRKRRRLVGVGETVGSFGAAVAAGAGELADALFKHGGGTVPAPSPSNQGGHVLPKEPSMPRSTIRRGSKGTLVALLQATIGIHADGDFGPATEAALKQWQRTHGLTPDGVAGPATWAIVDAQEQGGDDLEAFVPAQRTPVTPQQVYDALRSAWAAVVGGEPSRASLLVLLGQWGIETGDGKSLWNYNLGNVKRVQGQPFTMLSNVWEIIGGKKVVFQPPHAQTHFRAFATLEAGAEAYLRTMTGRFAKSWPQVIAGDPDAFARALKAQHYYTAPVDEYAKALRLRYAAFDKAIA